MILRYMIGEFVDRKLPKNIISASFDELNVQSSRNLAALSDILETRVFKVVKKSSKTLYFHISMKH